MKFFAHAEIPWRSDDEKIASDDYPDDITFLDAQNDGKPRDSLQTVIKLSASISVEQP